MTLTIATCGHGARPLDAYVGALRAHGVTRYVDVRRWPVSRRHPQFSRDALSDALQRAGIAYVHEEALGGHRAPRPDSANAGLRRELLRGYADWLETGDARAAIARVIAAATDEQSRGGMLAVACAEAKPDACHRQVLADALLAAGARVVHVVDASPARPHAPHRAAALREGRVSYPAPAPPRTLFD